MSTNHGIRKFKRLFVLVCVATASIAVNAQNDFTITQQDDFAMAVITEDAMLGWEVQNGEEDFFTVTDNVLQVSGNHGWLRSGRAYGDFRLTGEFRFLEPDSDSGIFLRVEPGTEFIRGWPGDAYQVQIRETSVNASDQPLPLMNLYRHRVPDGDTDYQRERAFALYMGVGEWQQFEIRVAGETVEAALNGEVVLTATGLVNDAGYIGIQSEKGVIEYRYLTIHAN